ncbi:hypothetical protein Y032_0006g2886 [Ancylostoma ceylanicum]|uniref:Uncharacterized protein n=1 Tax=Ancylostoma ceylanicum TaxID=53326 RepID=A0A016VPN2_9BILA|nr:hypothetical protein Y032_0006g2886 [Ancylostoma ceylanicum]
MTKAFERDADHSDLTVQDNEYFDDNDENMDVDWDIDCGNIETRSSPLVIEFGGNPIPIKQVLQPCLQVRMRKTAHNSLCSLLITHYVHVSSLIRPYYM